MKFDEFYAIANEYAPKRLSDEYCARYEAYDNSGVLVKTGEEVTKVLFALDLTNAAVDEAIACGADCIVTHHPVIYGKISDVSVDTPLGRKLVRCIQKGISVISMHLNLDVVQGGIDESLMEGVVRASGKTGGAGMRLTTMHPLEEGAYGRAYDIIPVPLETLAEGLKKELSCSRIWVYGDGDKKIARAVSCCGAGGDEEGVAFALREGADVLISSDFKHHVLTAARDLGLSVIVTTHYASENYGFKKYYEKMRRRTGLSCVYHEDFDLA